MISRVWEFFENLNDMVYVSDMDTYELVYMNRKTREMCGIFDVEEIRGKKCYELLQNCLNPCSICNNTELCEGEFTESRYYNPLLKKALLLKDSMILEDGHRYCFELALEDTSEEQARGALRNYETLEAQVNEGIRIALQAPTPDGSIDIILEYLGKALDGGRTYVFEQNENGGDELLVLCKEMDEEKREYYHTSGIERRRS